MKITRKDKRISFNEKTIIVMKYNKNTHNLNIDYHDDYYYTTRCTETQSSYIIKYDTKKISDEFEIEMFNELKEFIDTCVKYKQSELIKLQNNLNTELLAQTKIKKQTFEEVVRKKKLDSILRTKISDEFEISSDTIFKADIKSLKIIKSELLKKDKKSILNILGDVIDKFDIKDKNTTRVRNFLNEPDLNKYVTKILKES